MADDALLTIGDFARASGLTPKALRLYDDMGLLVPVEVDPVNGYRRYARHQLDRARLVARLRLAGMPLARIRTVADLPPAAAAAELTSYRRQVEADAATARRIVADLVEELSPEEEPMSHAPTTPFTSAARAGIGGRDTQLDAVRVDGALVAVADGFGHTPDVSEAALAALGQPGSVAELDDAVRRAADAVVAAAGHPDDGTTITALVLAGREVLVAHLGDSRAHLVREGRLERLTRDHTVVQTLVDEGRLSADEARLDDRRVLLNRALGTSTSAHPDLAIRVTEPGDRFVLTTDGVHAVLDPAALAAFLTMDAAPGVVVDAVADAVTAAGAPDNWSVVVVDLEG
ncbi:MerR family transcriptional regulator [Nocardioides marmotae]|uniref:MerR family transcriptional regulator n=1 Tax=Nocardioides marmotae TaxID=2663857 RepID=A0A6I3JED1_9ACTN|nr:MerR family transcriptional regulator [Nocardioides marmotae]MCR6032914.1 MerR family transcriptional regulator [Gordonia jinghuaiqii]MBC9733443.1 MerR family transcriptional regulator [Nocardioides marmotae]MTB84550.1 MerR family transcriptional regulator [Nocardioides marmotae]MTB96564.1 MerR family transcriptional regulator [Nocardioides marmotae]QKE01917.1 MerR family transcriptional regulator [Nocardioides marmotae]